MDTAQLLISNTPRSHARAIDTKDADADHLKTRTVDTDVTSRTAPAVIHEHIQPKLHDIQHTNIFREIHKHHIYHRILPVLETETLPTRHVVESSDGKGLVEVSVDQARRLTGRPLREWMVMPRSFSTHEQYNGEKWPPQTHKDNVQPSDRLLEVEKPILVDKKTHITEDGTLRTEYLWRHPPVFEDIHGRTVPVRIPAGLSDEWKQAVRQSKQKSAAAKQRDRPQETDERIWHVKGRNDVERDNPARRSANPNEMPPGRRMDKHVVPAQVKSMDKSQHETLAIRTKAKSGDTVQKGGEYPNLMRKSSLQDLKGIGEQTSPRTASDASREAEETSRVRKQTEERARQMFLESSCGSSGNKGPKQYAE